MQPQEIICIRYPQPLETMQHIMDMESYVISLVMESDLISMRSRRYRIIRN